VGVRRAVACAYRSIDRSTAPPRRAPPSVRRAVGGTAHARTHAAPCVGSRRVARPPLGAALFARACVPSPLSPRRGGSRGIVRRTAKPRADCVLHGARRMAPVSVARRALRCAALRCAVLRAPREPSGSHQGTPGCSRGTPGVLQGTPGCSRVLHVRRRRAARTAPRHPLVRAGRLGQSRALARLPKESARQTHETNKQTNNRAPPPGAPAGAPALRRRWVLHSNAVRPCAMATAPSLTEQTYTTTPTRCRLSPRSATRRRPNGSRVRRLCESRPRASCAALHAAHSLVRVPSRRARGRVACVARAPPSDDRSRPTLPPRSGAAVRVPLYGGITRIPRTFADRAGQDPASGAAAKQRRS
jgi:hypothetical protein